MRHKGEQRGSLRQRGGSWYGSFVTYTNGGGRKRREVLLGKTDVIDEKEARERLTGIVSKVNEGVTKTMVDPIRLLMAPRPSVGDGGNTAVTKGVVAELVTAADLTARGYEVFIPTSRMASCDLLAMKDGRVLRVEVKWIGKPDSKALVRRLGPNYGKFDLAALVLPSGKVRYELAASVDKVDLVYVAEESAERNGHQED